MAQQASLFVLRYSHERHRGYAPLAFVPIESLHE
jgi:hypothetical protein